MELRIVNPGMEYTVALHRDVTNLNSPHGEDNPTRTDQTRTDQTRPDQTRTEQNRTRSAAAATLLMHGPMWGGTYRLQTSSILSLGACWMATYQHAARVCVLRRHLVLGAASVRHQLSELAHLLVVRHMVHRHFRGFLWFLSHHSRVAAASREAPNAHTAISAQPQHRRHQRDNAQTRVYEAERGVS